MNTLEFWPAPMEGVFSASFIRAVNELGLTDRWMTSFFRLSESLPKLKYFREFLSPYMAAGLPVCAQLMGREPTLMAAGARRMIEAGAAGINLNFGCPAPRVARGGCGGALLREPALMEQIVRSVKEAAGKVEVSVKLRCGFSAPEELEKIVRALISGGTEKFFFHFRTVKELYAACPEREKRFGRFMELARDIPVVLNGDFNGTEGAEEAKKFRCAGIMLGRGFLADPGVFRRLTGKSPCSREEFCRALIRHGLSGEALKGMKRRIFGAWDFPLPPEEGGSTCGQ